MWAGQGEKRVQLGQQCCHLWSAESRTHDQVAERVTDKTETTAKSM